MAEAGAAVRAGNAQHNGRARPPAMAPGAARRRGGDRRRPLPGGRAVLGGLLVAASVVGLFYASTRTDEGPTASYVVARHDLPPGARLTAGDLVRATMELPPGHSERVFTDPAVLEGATTVAPLAAGDLVQSSSVVAKPSGPSSREVTFSVPRSTLAPTLEHGERVDVLATYGSGADAFTTVVLHQALVVALDRGRDRVGEQADTAVTVAVDDAADAVALAHALQLAKLTVVRATGSAPVDGGGAAFRQPVPPPPPAGTSAATSAGTSAGRP